MADKKKAIKLDSKVPDDIKEKTYISKQVDTSITLLESPENDIVLEALLFLSKYVDIKKNNLIYVQQRGIFVKLLKLFYSNICILRLALRLLDIILEFEDIFLEFEEGTYDDKIFEITNFYINHSDASIRLFSVSILTKLGKSCRITCFIFTEDLFNPIFSTLKNSKDSALIEKTLGFLYVLINAPAALGTLPTVKNFDINFILKYMKCDKENSVELVYKIFVKLSSYNIDLFQFFFRNAKLVEKMMATVVNPEKKPYHFLSLEFIQNCLESDETNTYFIQSVDFLTFCHWSKTCEPEYFQPLGKIFKSLSKNPSIKQTLFDLSVEDAILYLLRSKDKNTATDICEAISNMSVHKYCCERMLTVTVVQTLLEILFSDGEINEICLRTISDFCRRNITTIDILDKLNSIGSWLHIFMKGPSYMSEDSFLRLMDILNRFAMHPDYQEHVLSKEFFENLLKTVEDQSDTLATLATEIMTYFAENELFISSFVSMGGPTIILSKLKSTKDSKLFRNLLIFIHSCLIRQDIIETFIKQGMVTTLNALPEFVKCRSPIIEKILNLTYDVYLPLKFFHFGRLEIKDILPDKFFIICGSWETSFPFLDILLALQVCPLTTFYLIDYTYKIKKSSGEEDNISKSSYQLELNSIGSVDLSLTSLNSTCFYNCRGVEGIDEELLPDTFLPRYIYHMRKILTDEMCIGEKVELLAKYVDSLLCGPLPNNNVQELIHTFDLHIKSLKHKFKTSIIPIGYVRIGLQCERALLFKAIADKVCIPCSLVKGKGKIYWNEVALLNEENGPILEFYVVDLMKNVGNLLMVGSREANFYCNTKA